MIPLPFLRALQLSLPEITSSKKGNPGKKLGNNPIRRLR